MLDIRLKKTYSGFTVLTAFTLREVGITALFGPSGAGKTSVINMIAGLVLPDEGHVIVNNRCLYDSRRGISIPPEKRRCGYVFQDGRLFPHLTVKSNLTYGMKRVAPGNRYVTLAQVVDLLGIGSLLRRRPATLSGGEKQRVAIGRTLLTSPALLLMDEPLASLDSARKQEVLPFIARLPRELSIPIIYVTHDLNEIRALADTIVFLDSGKTISTGPLEEVTKRWDVSPFCGDRETGQPCRPQGRREGEVKNDPY